MERILVLGSGGAGKSTLSLALSRKLGLPVVHLDQHYWLPNWVERDRSQWEATLGPLLAGDRWVMDGNFATTLPVRLERATLAVFLDLPRSVCAASALYRRVRYAGRGRIDLPQGCRESFDLDFLRYIWRYPEQTRPRVLSAVARSGVPLVHLESRGQARRWLHQLTPRRSVRNDPARET